MDSGSIAAIIVAVIALVSAYASQRAASKASVANTATETRVDMERDAYLRARKIDTETISRIEKENVDLRKSEAALQVKTDELERRLEEVKQEAKLRIDNLEKEVHRWKMAYVRFSKNPEMLQEALDVIANGPTFNSATGGTGPDAGGNNTPEGQGGTGGPSA